MHSDIRDILRTRWCVECAWSKGILWAFNSLITTSDFYAVLFHDSFAEHSFINMLVTCFNLFGVATLLALQRLQHLVSLRVRILCSQQLVFTAFVMATAFAMAIPDTSLEQPRADHAVTSVQWLLCIATIASVGQGVFIGSIVSYATLFKAPRYMQAVTGGQALAGFAVSLGNLMRALPDVRGRCDVTAVLRSQVHGLANASTTSLKSELSDKRAIATGAARYFACACAVLMLCTLSFVILERLPITLRCQQRAKWDAGEHANALVRAKGQSLPIWSKAGVWACAGLLNFAITLSIFPGLSSTIGASSDESCLWKGLFVPLMFVLFNLGDLIGRNITCFMPRRAWTAVSLVLLRLLFAPLFAACAAMPSLPDVLPMVAMLAFSISNGWLFTAVFIRAPEQVTSAEAPQVGTLMVLFVNLGLALGSVLSFGTRWAICHCNPFFT